MKYWMIHCFVLLIISSVLSSCTAQNDSRRAPTVNLEESIVPYVDVQPSDQIAEYVRNIFEDRNGNLWMGTNGRGVAMYDGTTLKYFDPSNGLSGPQVTDVMQASDGKIWITTYGGISVYNGESFKNYTTDDGLSNDWMWSVYEDSQGQIWAGGIHGLCKLQGDRFVTVHIPGSDDYEADSRFTGQWVRDFLEVDQELWIATAGLGICIYDGETFRFINSANGLCNDDISCLMKDSNNNIWIATRFGGVCRYDGQTFNTYDMTNGIGNYESIVVYEDNANNIWFSSEGFGLYKLEGEELTNFAQDQGLGIRAVQTVYQDSKGRFWTGGGGGLYRLFGDNFINVTKDGPWN